MGQDASPVGTPTQPVSGPTPLSEDPALLRAEIERTRLELGDTVAALAGKTDVKARAKEKVAGVRHTVDEKRTALVGKARETSPDGASSVNLDYRFLHLGRIGRQAYRLAACGAPVRPRVHARRGGCDGGQHDGVEGESGERSHGLS